MKVFWVILIAASMGIGVSAHQGGSFSLEQLFPPSASSAVLDISMQVCSDLVLLGSSQEMPPSIWLDALLGKMVRLQTGIERLSDAFQESNVHADDLVYLLAMIHRVEIAAESAAVDGEYQALYHTLLSTIKRRLAHLLTQVYAGQMPI